MNNVDLYPLAFEPRYVPKIWGGERLKTMLGKALPPGQKIGESWEIYDLGEESAVVAEGPLKGQTLGTLVKEYGPRLLGEAAWEKSPDRFPLMVKFIDSSDWTSVQVHPDDDYAATHLGPEASGKTEMWKLLAAEEGTELIVGLKEGNTRADFKRALLEGKLEKVLNRFPVQKGDVFFLPAGRVHAIGKGCLLAEVQQNADITYRVYDFNRLEKGRPRPLHVEQALETIRFEEALPDKHALPVVCPHFRVDALNLRHETFVPEGSGVFHILMGLKGEGTLFNHGRESVILRSGRSLLVPASLDWKLQPAEEGLEALWVRPGE